MNHARASIATGDILDVRRFDVDQRIGRPFRVELMVRSDNPSIDSDEALGFAASFELRDGAELAHWTGVCTELDQVAVELGGLSTYRVVIEPRVWLLSQRTNYRIFQYKSELDIVRELFAEWGISHRVRADFSVHKARKFRVQYGESDMSFALRLLEDAGISLHFSSEDDETVVVLDDRPNAVEPHTDALQFHDEPAVVRGLFATDVSIAQRTRPGSAALGDLDYRRSPMTQPRIATKDGLRQEAPLEVFDYEPGAMLYQVGSATLGVSADDRGSTRTDEARGSLKTAHRLASLREDALRIDLSTNALSLAPGQTLRVTDHPHPAACAPMLVVGSRISGEHDESWLNHLECSPADAPYVPPRTTPKPVVSGLESAVVTGGPGDEIHTDEYGRVRVQFHWDREGRRDASSSCWIPTSQVWSGPGFGGVMLPRVGQEVLVEFLNGDPDRPVVTGRVFTHDRPPPFELPRGATLTGFVGRTTPALVFGASDGLQEGHIVSQWHSSRAQDAAFRAAPPDELLRGRQLENMFLVGDRQGQNLAFLQARRDLNLLVKNAWSTVVGNFRGVLVGGDDRLRVNNKQQFVVVLDQGLRVVRDQTLHSHKDRTELIFGRAGLIVDKEVRLETTGELQIESATSLTLEAGEALELEVGQSKIWLTPSEVVFDSPEVRVNEG
jgi:type VI secretion system secreted protein VgrG